MTTVFLFCGLSSTLMFFLFFIVPNLDKILGKAKTKERTPKSDLNVVHNQRRMSA